MKDAHKKMNEFLRASRSIEQMTLEEEIPQDPIATKINEFLRRGTARTSKEPREREGDG